MLKIFQPKELRVFPVGDHPSDEMLKTHAEDEYVDDSPIKNNITIHILDCNKCCETLLGFME